MYQASCLCKQIRIFINGPIADIIHCHCSLCRKSSGTAFATNGFVTMSDLEIKDANGLLTFYQVKPGKKRYFCAQCASPIYSTNDSDLSRVRLRLGILDSDIEERPISHNFVSSKANWDSLNIELPQYDGYEPSRS
ncbi:MAG: GFA family protein [Gammaproteobacteria bacterium]|nr:GFA family protein [Gammaproteobacteria bacterium]